MRGSKYPLSVPPYGPTWTVLGVQAPGTPAAKTVQYQLGALGAAFGFQYATIAALRANTITTLGATFVQNYATPGDNGGGFFIYNASDTTSTDNGGTIIIDALGHRWYRQYTGAISLAWFGGNSVGTASNTAAFEAALAVSPSINIGPGQWRFDTPVNATNLNLLQIFGAGMMAPAYGLALVPPAEGAVIIANCGTGVPWIDCTGANNVLMRDLMVTSLSATNKSDIGMIFGTSTGAQVGEPGGTNICLENVGVQLADANMSCPVYFNGGSGLSHFTNVWTLGRYGLYFCTGNPLNIVPPFGVFGVTVNVDGVIGNGCSLLGYGEQPVLVLTNANNHQWNQLYLATTNGGAGYTGTDYPMVITNGLDIDIKVEVDYFPSVVEFLGTCENVSITGTSFPYLTPVPVNIPAVAFFNGTSVINSEFLVKVVTSGAALPNANYYYTSVSGASPTMTAWKGCSFLFDTVVGNCFYGNVTGAPTVGFFNLTFNGNADAPGMTFLVNGSVASTANERYFINGKSFGAG